MEKSKSVIKGLVELDLVEIESVERGNMLSNTTVDRKVCAFSVVPPNSVYPVKVLLKGKLACDIYSSELSNGKSMTKSGKKTLVSIKAYIRELRKGELVLENPVSIEFFSAKEYK